ncbi:MAG: phophatidylserine decarboxylase associated domain-containing protein [Chthoniobacterales bacterium]
MHSASALFRNLVVIAITAAFLPCLANAAKPTAPSKKIGHVTTSEDPQTNIWLASLRQRVDKEGKQPYKPSVQKFADLIASDGIVRMYVSEMLTEAAKRNAAIDSPDVLLKALNLIIQEAPQFADGNYFPVSTLFVYMMDTEAGRDAFAYPAINTALRDILKEWCAYLDSPVSLNVLNKENGWLSPKSVAANALAQCIIPQPDGPHGGFTSFNDFFHRKIRPELRPIAEPENAKVITSSNDGSVYAIAHHVKKTDQFWIKKQRYSLYDMLGGSPFTDRFVGGDVIQSFLSGNDYHRYHAPIAGTVREVRVVDGLMFSALNLGVFDKTAGTLSQGYQASVNTRGLLFIESEDPKIGTVCMIPIGITEVSSVHFSVKEGDVVKKGQEVGYFSYGGSSMCLVFQPGTVKKFLVTPAPNLESGDDGPKIKVNQAIAEGN